MTCVWQNLIFFPTHRALLKLTLFLSCDHKTLLFSRNLLEVLPTCPSSYSRWFAVSYQILCLPMSDWWHSWLVQEDADHWFQACDKQNDIHILLHFQKKAAPHYHYWFCKHVSAGKYLSDNNCLMKLREMTSLPLTFRATDSGRTKIYHL